jgi:two-component system phosphate regulon sensor histidine kinase PhoR
MRRRLLFANATARRLFALDENDTGRLLAEVLRSPRFHDLVEATLNSEQPRRQEVTVVDRRTRARGGTMTLLVHGACVPGAPVGGAILVFHDVTELRRLERMRQDFVANASHELKTPLAAIRAYTETLLDGAIHDESVNLEFLQRIDEQAERLNNLVLDMLSLSRLDTGQEAFVHGPLAVGPVVSAVVESHKARASAKKQQLVLRATNLDESVRVYADEEALRQVLDNLIDNAIKYTPDEGRVTVSCRAQDEEVEFEVSDTGIGIARDELSRIFERFYRVDKARSRMEGGTGLGLAIVKHLVQSLGGHISVRSRLNAGSSFTVTLPRLERAARAQVHGPHEPSLAT